MAEDFIEELYYKADIIFEIKKLIKYCRRTQILLFRNNWINLQEPIADFCKSIVTMDAQLGQYLWQQFVSVGQDVNNNDLLIAADTLDDLIPHLYDAMKLYGEIDVTEGSYRLFSTKSGFLGIHNLESKNYITGNNDPAWEAYENALEIYRPTMRKFCTFGCNLGYLCWQMWEISSHSIDIYIYDADYTMYEYAMRYGVLGRIPKENIHLIVNNDLSKLMREYLNNDKDYSNDTAVLNIDVDTVDKLNCNKDALMNLLITLNSEKNLFSMSEHNFYRNTWNVKKTIYDYKIITNTEKCIIVGGGPSVNYCIDYIKRNVGIKTIIAATTIYNRLINEGIKPDIIVCVDPQNRTYGHLANVTDTSTPLFLVDVSNWQFSEKYVGDKYIIPTADFYFATKHYSNHNIKTWTTRGTVPGMCIDVAAFLGAKEIELIGVDLSYPNNQTHASGTMDNKEISHDGMVKIKSNNGGEVYTTDLFKSYIFSMQEQIKSYSRIKFYNLSKDGAAISGAPLRSV